MDDILFSYHYFNWKCRKLYSSHDFPSLYTSNAFYTPVCFVDLQASSSGEIRTVEWRWIVDNVVGMRSIPNVRGSRYSNNAISMREALQDYVNGETWSGEWQWDHVRRTTMEFKTRHLCSLLLNFKIISLVRKPKKYLKGRANFSKVASYQHVTTPGSIYCFKVNYKELEQGVIYVQS